METTNGFAARVVLSRFHVLEPFMFLFEYDGRMSTPTCEVLVVTLFRTVATSLLTSAIQAGRNVSFKDTLEKTAKFVDYRKPACVFGWACLFFDARRKAFNTKNNW